MMSLLWEPPLTLALDAGWVVATMTAQMEALSGFLILGRCWRFMRIAHGLATTVHKRDEEAMHALAEKAVSCAHTPCQLPQIIFSSQHGTYKYIPHAAPISVWNADDRRCDGGGGGGGCMAVVLLAHLPIGHSSTAGGGAAETPGLA